MIGADSQSGGAANQRSDGRCAGVTARLWVRLGTRLLVALATLFVVFLATFLLMHQAPGGPFAGAERLSAEAQVNLEQRFGLNDPLPVQFIRMAKGVLAGDLGPSLAFAPGRDVAEVIGAAAPVSLLLGAFALLFALLIGVGGGLLAGMAPGRWYARALGAVSLVVISLSVLVVGGLLKHWALGEGSPFYLGISQGWRGWVLPAVSLGLAYGAIYFRLVRAAVAELYQGPRFGAVSARGVSGTRVVLRYILPEALIPLLSYLGPSLAGILTGSFVVERLFELPGLSACFVQGALARDYPLVAGAILFYTALLVTLNFLFETLHTVLDPRLRRSVGGGGER